MRKNDSIPAKPGMFRNNLAPAAAVFLGLGALLGLGCVLQLLDPSYPAAIQEKILLSGVRTESALGVWSGMQILISLICCFCPALTVFCMVRAFRGQPAQGMNLLSNAAHWLLVLLRILGWILVGIFCLRFGLYVIRISRRQDWLYQLFATTVMEALMLVLAWYTHRLLCRFLDEAEGCTASIGYTLSTGKLDPGTIPAFVASGLTILGILGMILTVAWLITMTVAYDGYKYYYAFVWSSHPDQWLSAGSLLFGAVGDLLLAGYLRFYKRTGERAIFFATYGK